MSEPVERKCSGCKAIVKVWYPARMIHHSEANLLAACEKCRPRFQKIYDEHVKECKRLGINF